MGLFKKLTSLGPSKPDNTTSLPPSHTTDSSSTLTDTSTDPFRDPSHAGSTRASTSTAPTSSHTNIANTTAPTHRSGMATSSKKLPVPPTRTTTGNSIEALDRFEAAGAGVSPDFARRHHKEPHRSTPGHNMNAYDYPTYPSSRAGEGEHIYDPKAHEVEMRDKRARGYDAAVVPDYIDEATDLDPAGRGIDGRSGGRGTKHSAFGLGGPGLGAEMVPEPEGAAWKGTKGLEERRAETEKYAPVRNSSYHGEKGDRGVAGIEGGMRRVVLNGEGNYAGGEREMESHHHTGIGETIPTWRHYEDSNVRGRETEHTRYHDNARLGTGHRSGDYNNLKATNGIYDQQEGQYVNDPNYGIHESQNLRSFPATRKQTGTPDVSDMPGGFADEQPTHHPNSTLGGYSVPNNTPTTQPRAQPGHINFSSRPSGEVDDSKLANPNPANASVTPATVTKNSQSGNNLPRPADLQQKQFSGRLHQPHTTTSSMPGMGAGYTGTHSSTPTSHIDPSGVRAEKQRYGAPSSSNEIRQQVPPGASDNYVPMSQRHIAGGRGAMEPSVGADPASGQSMRTKSSDVANPLEDPGEGARFGGVSLHEQRSGGTDIGEREGAKERYNGNTPGRRVTEQNEGDGEGSGEQWVKSTGTIADGGNFDAAAPGAGREADRLFEENGIDRKAGKSAAALAGTKQKVGLGQKLGLHK